jgi:vitamin-K-epoxide reductase (warfarin-sensitive)
MSHDKSMASFAGASITDSPLPHSTIEDVAFQSAPCQCEWDIPGRRNCVRYVIVLFAVLGIIVSSLALKVHYDDPGKEPCSINDKWDCGVVNHSPYAMIHGVPVAAIGISGYLLIAIAAFTRRRAFTLVLILVGLAFALHLTSIEAHVLEVWCLYCVISQGIIAVLTVLSLIWLAWPKLRPSSA